MARFVTPETPKKIRKERWGKAMWNVEEIEPFFRAAMKVGFAESHPKGTISELPGSKTIVFEEGRFRLVDLWFVGERGRSAGSITIFAENSPVWVMNFWGHYEKAAIPFLKSALRQEYMRDFHPPLQDPQFFKGCRGPRLFRQSRLTYINTTDPGGDFTEFSGREDIIDHETGNVSRGWHKYTGFLLI